MTADTYSGTLGVILMGTGNDNNSWGSNQNQSVFQIFEDAIANTLTSAVSGGTLDLSGTPPPAGPSQARYAALLFTGTLTANQILKVPNLTKWWWINNQTSGSFSLTVQTPTASATGLIPQNSGWQIVQCDGNNNITVSPFNFAQVLMPDGSLTVPAYSNVNEPTSGLRRAGTQDWRFVVNGADILQITGPGAATPSVVNVMAGSLQSGGTQVIPAGTELPFAGVTLPTGFLFEYGQAVSRTTYPNLLAALRAQFTGAVTNGSNTITGVSLDLRNLGLEGSALEGNGITGLTISNITSSTITMSGNATAGSGGTQTCFSYPYGNGDGSTTFNVPDRRGRAIAGRDNMGTAGSAPAGRLTTAGSNFNGIELAGTGGAQNETLTQENLPNVNFPNSGITVQAGALQLAMPVQGSVTGTPGLQAFQTVTAASTILNIPSFIGAWLNNLTVGNQGAAASGGTDAPFTTVQPTGISNYIIKY